MKSKSIKLGIYSSYNDSEKVNGDIEPAVAVSNRDYLIWLEKSIIIQQKFQFPTVFIVKIKGKEKYYRGKLLEVKRRSELTNQEVKDILSDVKHRPDKWRKMDQVTYKDFKSVLHIRGLDEIPQPPEIFGIRPPERPIYIEFEDC